MRFVVLAMALLSIHCGRNDTAQPAAAATPLRHAAPVDQSRWMPLAGRGSTELIPDHMNGKAYLPGGTVGHYKNYDLWLVQAGTAPEAAALLLEYKKDLANAKLVPSFGGYFGEDAGKANFLFTKGSWLAGVSGLPEAQADAVARPFAALIR